MLLENFIVISNQNILFSISHVQDLGVTLLSMSAISEILCVSSDERYKTQQHLYY